MKCQLVFGLCFVLLFNFCIAKDEVKITLQDVSSVNENGNNIKYQNLRFTEKLFRFKSFNMDMRNLLVDIIAEVGGDISIDGTYVIDDKSEKLSMVFKNIKTTGTVGLERRDEYRLIPMNYYLTYSYSDVIIAAGKIPVAKSDLFPISVIWMEIENTLTEALHKQLDSMVDGGVEIGDHPTSDPTNTDKANTIIDNLLIEAHKLDNRTSLIGSNLNVVYQKNIKISTDDGQIKNLNTLERYQNFSIIETESNTFVFGYLNLGDFEYSFSNLTIDRGNDHITSGNVTTLAKVNKILVGINFDHLNECKATVSAKFVDISEISSKYTNAANWLSTEMAPWILGHLRIYSSNVDKWIVSTFEQVYNNASTICAN